MTSCERLDFSWFRDFSRPCAEENFPPRPAPCLRKMRRIPATARAEPSFETSGRGAVGGGGIKAASKAFLQAFPNLACFCPSFSKQSFGHFVGFQWVTRAKNQKVPPPNFFVPTASFQPYFRRRPAVSRVRTANGVQCGQLAVGGVCDAQNGRVHGDRGDPDRANLKSSTNSGLRKEISVILP